MENQQQYQPPQRPERRRSATMTMALEEEPKKFATAINNGIESRLPRVTESYFKARVIPILSKIMVPAHRAAYQKIVVDLMFPLYVIDDHDPDKVLHIIPPIAPTPRTTVPQVDAGLSVADVMHNMDRYRELNRLDIIDDTMRGFLGRITIMPSVVDDILLPIHRILQVYGAELDVTADAKNPLGRDALPQAADKREEAGNVLTLQSSSFTEEEDED